MTDIDTAANAFDTALGNVTHQSGGGMGETIAAEEMFGNLSSHEEDVAAGGDDKKGEEEGEFDPEKPFSDDAEEDGKPKADEDEDEEDEDEEDEEGADKGLMDREFTVMVDGQEMNVPLREALNGYIRTQTFHQRMNQLDQVRTQVAGYAENLVNDRTRVDEMLSDAEELIKGVLPAEPDWDRLFEEDPKAARALQVQFSTFSNKISEIRTRRAQIAKDVSEKAVRDKADYARQELPKFYQVAGFKSKEEATSSIGNMRRTAINSGFSEEEVAGVLDHRMLNILLKAAKYDAIVANKPRPAKSGKTPVKPGTVSQSGSVRKGIQSANKNHARNGSVESAAGVFAKMLNR